MLCIRAKAERRSHRIVYRVSKLWPVRLPCGYWPAANVEWFAFQGLLYWVKRWLRVSHGHSTHSQWPTWHNMIVILMLRTYALWERKRAILITLWVLSVVRLYLPPHWPSCPDFCWQFTFVPAIIVTSFELSSLQCGRLFMLLPCILNLFDCDDQRRTSHYSRAGWVFSTPR